MLMGRVLPKHIHPHPENNVFSKLFTPKDKQFFGLPTVTVDKWTVVIVTILNSPARATVW